MNLKKKSEIIQAASLEYYDRLRSTKKRAAKRKKKTAYTPMTVDKRKSILKRVCAIFNLDRLFMEELLRINESRADAERYIF